MTTKAAGLSLPPPKPDPHPPLHPTPQNACDAHCHLFGPADRFPYAEVRPYTPSDAGLEAYQTMAATLGLSRAVFVQPACHGYDHSAILDALAQGKGRYRGVALGPVDIDGGLLGSLDRAGFRALRFNFVSHLGGGASFEACIALSRRLADLDWHLTLHMSSDALLELAPRFGDLACPLVIDHMGRIDARLGLNQPAFLALLAAMDREATWVKISAADRAGASGAPYEDVVAFGRALIAAAPERILWGTDWPHPNVTLMPDDGDLMDLLARFAPDAVQRARILVDNPHRLYGFAEPVTPPPG